MRMATEAAMSMHTRHHVVRHLADCVCGEANMARHASAPELSGEERFGVSDFIIKIVMNAFRIYIYVYNISKLYYIVLYCIVLYCIVLYCIVLY